VANKITVLVDLVTDRAQQSVKGFRSAVADADGAVGKFRAGASSAMSTVQANAGSLALAGGAALVAFGTKAVTAFQDTALAAGKFSDATGLAVEDASRLIEVAGDVGIGAGTIESAIVRMNSAAAKGDLEKFGVELQRTADGTVDVNATFLETIDVLNGIKDPTERALAAQKIFGKGYKEIAEIIFDNADRVQKKLGEVSEAKVIDPKELEKARKFRESMDNLNDALDDIKLAGGEALVPLLSGLADVTVLANQGRIALDDVLPGDVTINQGAIPFFIDAVTEAKDALTGGAEGAALFESAIRSLLPEINEAGHIVGGLADDEAEAETSTVSLSRAIDRLAFPKLAEDARYAATGVEEMADEADDAVTPFDALAGAIAAVGEAVDTAFEDVRDRIGLEGALDEITEQFDKIRIAGEEANEKGEAGTRAYKEEVRRLRLMLLDLLEDVKNVSAQDRIRLVAEIERGSVDELFRILGELSKGVSVPVVFSQPQQAFSGVDVVVGSNFAPQPIINNANPAPVNNSQTTIIYPVGTSPTSVTVDRRLYDTRNGTTPR
jgi:hypothetical protein